MVHGLFVCNVDTKKKRNGSNRFRAALMLFVTRSSVVVACQCCCDMSAVVC